jgi:hypothetical protein
VGNRKITKQVYNTCILAGKFHLILGFLFEVVYQEWFINLARLPFLVASIDSDALREMINASLRPAKANKSFTKT